MSPASIENLPQEIVASVVSYLDRPSLLALIRTTRFLRPHAEYQLYRRVDFRAADVNKNRWNHFQSLDWGGDEIHTQTVKFLRKIVNNPRLGTLVRSFYTDEIECQMLHTATSTWRTVDLLSNAINFFPNLKSIALYHPDEIPACLVQSQWNGKGKVPPFQLERLGLHTRRPRIIEFPRHLLELLQRQPALRQFSLMFTKSSVWVDPLRSSGTTSAPEDVCPALEVLEGTNSIIRFLLPKRPRIKSVFWECARLYMGEALDHRQVDLALGDVDVDLRDAFFTPEMCEAYGRLENLVLSDQIWFLPLLSPYLKSLKTLLLSVGVTIQSHSAPWDERLFLRAIGEMRSLEVLVVTWAQDRDVDERLLDPEVVFSAASKTLKYFAVTVHARGAKHVPVFMERRGDGDIGPVGSEKFEEIMYLHKGWFTYGTEDGRMDGVWTGFGPRIFARQ